jgi:hypothetical protein
MERSPYCLSDCHFIVGGENASQAPSVRIIGHQIEEHCLISGSRISLTSQQLTRLGL